METVTLEQVEVIERKEKIPMLRSSAIKGLDRMKQGAESFWEGFKEVAKGIFKWVVIIGAVMFIIF